MSNTEKIVFKLIISFVDEYKKHNSWMKGSRMKSNLPSLKEDMKRLGIVYKNNAKFPSLNETSLSLSQTLAGMSEFCSPLLEGCQKNRQHWKRLAEECEKGLVNGLVWSGTRFYWVRPMQSCSHKASVNQHNASKDEWHALFMEIGQKILWD